jgi:acylphosphatase
MAGGAAAAPAGRRFLVSGRVQRVFFRAGTAREAARLGLSGWARNLDDGRVEVLAAGSEQALDALARWLETGTPQSRVEQVEVAPASESDMAGIAGFQTR